ncbi:hypothetical protein FOZ63_028125 [Perkinsus olseni]|uniref:Uncharacterized protein n=1 Tax=Perkinsus olseni TaxID=32597 RepID=A0A7J6P6K0_PEROL|nr:hypothetical protein FOZ63_028125 [Perkinsus olseni]
MACTDDFIFVLFDAQHLFCVDRLSPDDRAQAKLIWSSRCREVGSSRLLVDVRKPQEIQVLISSFHHSWTFLTLELQSRQEPLYFSKVTRTLSLQGGGSANNTCIQNVLPVGQNLLVVVHRSSNNGERVLALFDRSFHPLGPATPLSDANEYRDKALVCGERDTIYSMEEDHYFRHRQVVYGGSSDDDDWKPPMRKVKAARTSSGPRMISSHYVAKE